MEDKKLFGTVEKLNGVEKREFTHFIQSPYFNQRTDIIRLWEWILKQKQKAWQPEQGFAYVYPDTVFEDAQWRYVQTFLLAAIESFLAQRSYEQIPLLSDLHLVRVYRQKGITKPLSYTLRRAEDKLAKMPHDNEFYYFQYQLEWEKYAAGESQHRTGDNNLAAVGKALDIYLVSSKLRLACLTASHRAVFQVEYDAVLLGILLDYVEKSPLKEIPIVALYFHCYLALTSGSESDFRAFRRELEQHPDLPADERRTFLLLAVNFCIKRLNTGEKHYIREAFGLYKVGLETGVLIEHGILSRFAYKNIVALGLILEEYDWIKRFIPDYEPFLEEKYRSATRDYNMARLFFTQKDYKKAMPLLARVDETDLLLNLDSRVMLLKMYYETAELDALDALLASFRILLLRKKKVIGYHQQHYLNTVRYIQKLSRLNRNDKKLVLAFRDEVLGNKAVIEKDWLLAQVT